MSKLEDSRVDIFRKSIASNAKEEAGEKGYRKAANHLRLLLKLMLSLATHLFEEWFINRAADIFDFTTSFSLTQLLKELGSNDHPTN